MNNIKNIELCKNFGKHLRLLRNNAKKSQEQLANDADIPISQVGRIERGEINATLSTLHALSKALNISLQNLMEFPVD